MAAVILLHSVCGFRSLERQAAARLRAAGHEVLAPDLYGGRTAGSVDEGFQISEAIGWSTLCGRAERAAAEFPETAVLAGFSMGAGIAASLWQNRPQTAGLLALHSVVEIPENARDKVPMQVHLADPDKYEPADEVAAWSAAAAGSRIALEMFTYPGVGHLFADHTLPDYDAEAARLMWGRVDRFLAGL